MQFFPFLIKNKLMYSTGVKQLFFYFTKHNLIVMNYMNYLISSMNMHIQSLTKHFLMSAFLL